MLSIIIVVFLALLFYFILKLLYNIVIIILIAQLVGKLKATGTDLINEKMGKDGGEQNGKEG